MKWTFKTSLHELMRKDERVFLIIGDVGVGLFSEIEKEFPRRYLNAGLLEQSMVSMAAGMAMQGFRPIVYTITPFLVERAFEQIKIDVHLMKQPVGLVGYSEPGHGPTHECLDARALMALCPNIECFYPRTKAAVTSIMADIDLDAPWFLNLRPEEPQCH